MAIDLQSPSRAQFMRPAHPSDLDNMLSLGARVSVFQSGLFLAIGLSAAALGIERFVNDGLAGLAHSNPGLFQFLCACLVVIAWLGLAITPAEQALVARWNGAWAAWGARMALIGHAGTMTFFAWWLLVPDCGQTASALCAAQAAVAPLAFGLAFELVLVGAWVWVIALAAHHEHSVWPRGFFWLSVAKASSFWVAWLAVLAPRPAPLPLALGTVTMVTGPLWHAWVARIMRNQRASLPP